MSKRLLLKTALLVIIIFLAGCISTFTPVDPDFRPKGKKLAVVAGLENEQNIMVAYYMTQSLQKNSRFQVVPQKQVAQALGYPIKIQGPFKTAYFQIETDYGKTDTKKIKAIQQKLGVDYVYAVWTPSETVYNQKIHSLHAVGQLFEGDREVGNGRFDVTAGRTDCCLVPAPGNDDKENAVRDTTDYVAREIAQKTGMQK